MAVIYNVLVFPGAPTCLWHLPPATNLLARSIQHTEGQTEGGAERLERTAAAATVGRRAVDTQPVGREPTD